jgi:hypothetical protein
MAGFYLVHAGTGLYRVGVNGDWTAISLPAGVTVTAARPARFATLNQQVVVTNAVSANIVVNPFDLSTRLLNIAGPGASVPTLASGGSGVLTGEYRYRVTYAIRSGATVLTESPYSDIAGPITVSSNDIDLSNIPVSGTTGVNARRIYRTGNGGAEFFLLTTIADNSTTTYTDNTSDFDLALLPSAETLGNAPGVDSTDRLRLIVSWKDRLWGAPADNPDRVHYTDNRVVYAWGAAAFVTVKPIGQDLIGVTGFAARRDDLLVGKKRSVWIVRGIPPDTIELIQVFEGPGPLSQDAFLVIHDVAYYLGEDGVYQISGTGVENISKEKVHPWFTTDTYFNRAVFDQAFMTWNPLLNQLELHLAAAGSTAIDRWVSFDLQTRQWLGPHRTGAFTPTISGLMEDEDALLVPVMGSSSGFLYTENSSTISDDGTAIDFDITTKFHAMNTPDVQKYFGELSIVSKIESAGTLTLTPSVGGLDASAGSAISHSLTTGRQRLRRQGTGRYWRLRLQQASNNQSCEVYGLELPYHELGRR